MLVQHHIADTGRVGRGERRRAERSGFGRAASASGAAAPSAAASAAPALAVPAVPTGYAELDKALTKGADGKLPFDGKTVSIQTQWIGGEGTNFAASVADFAKATGIKIQIDSIGSSHETVLKTRIEGGKPPDLAMLAQPTPILAYAKQGKVIDVAPFMDRRQAQPRSIRRPSAWSPRAARSGASRTRPT